MYRVLEIPHVSEYGDRISEGAFQLMIVEGDYLMCVGKELYRVDLEYCHFGEMVLLTASWSDSVVFCLTREQYDRVTGLSALS